MVFRALGVLEIAAGTAAVIVALGVGSAALVAAVVTRAPALTPAPAWLALDVALVTWGVAASGGLASPWYLWYPAIAGAGAFAAGRRGALLVSLANAAAYLGTLAARHEIGLFDRPFLVALARLVFLHGAAFFFLRGVADLAARRVEIKRLRDGDARRLADLERLATALDQRTRELIAANRRIREADRQKSRFLANVSHELRTPLNSILGFSQIVATRFAAELPEKPLRFVANIRTSGEHLLRVLDDLLDLSKIEAGRMALEPAPLDPRKALEEALAAAHGEAAARGIGLAASFADALPTLEADPVKLRQVLLNLLSNAIRFSPDKGTVTASAELVGATGPRAEAVRFSVRDEGSGIEPEDQAIVFDEFRQARHRAHAGGTGLGLALVKSIAELHGGAVGLVSAPGRGSTFHVDLPVRFRGTREPRSDQSSSGEVAAIQPARVLIVSSGDTSALQRALERSGCLALGCAPGPDALRLGRTLRPAALVVEADGPESWTFVRQLASDPETREIAEVLLEREGADGWRCVVLGGAGELPEGTVRATSPDEARKSRRGSPLAAGPVASLVSAVARGSLGNAAS